MPFLDRPELDDRIRAALRVGSVVLHGSLGYGKTTVLRSALRAFAPPVARYETAPWERGRFALPLIEAIAAVRPDFGRRTRALAEADAPIEAVAEAFAIDLAHVRSPLAIAIDDGGDIADDTFCAFLRTLSHAIPAEVHLAIASRRDVASSLRAPIARFDEIDLRFTRDEISRLLDTTNDATIARVVQATGGWPAAVALTVAPETIPEITRAALEPFAVYERIAAADVRAFHSLGAFVDIGEGHVVLQPIVRAQTIAAMRSRADGSLERAHLAAADAQERCGNFSAALFHFEAGGANDRTFAFLHRAVPVLALSGDLALVDALLRRAQVTDPADRALAAYVSALMLHRTGDPRAGERFAEAFTLAETAGASAIALNAQMRATEFALARGRGLDRTTIGHLRELAAETDADATGGVAVLDGWNHAILGEFADALALLEPYDAVATTREGSSIELLRAYAETSLGSVERARRRMDALIAALENSDHFILHVQALIWYARLALLWGETAIALDYANEAHRRAAGFDSETESAALFAALAEASAHAGNADDAIRWASALRRSAGTAWYAVDAARLAAIADQQTARALFARGDSGGARSLAEAGASDPHVPAPTRAALLADAAAYASVARDRCAPEAIARAFAAVAEARPMDAADGIAIAGAETILDSLVAASGADPVERAASTLGVYDTLVRARNGSMQLPTVALALRADDGSRPQSLANALELFTVRGPRFEAALIGALARSQNVAAPARATYALPEALTEREAQVLELLVEGLTNREIAERLILGTRTIETHVEHVLAKLGVGSRTRAIAAALRLGIVTPNAIP